MQNTFPEKKTNDGFMQHYAKNTKQFWASGLQQQNAYEPIKYNINVSHVVI